MQEHRSYKPGVPKAHYTFSYESSLRGAYSGTVLLDVLNEDSKYPETTEKIIEANWIETDEEVKVTVPTIDSITGDKLTAFAPSTIGIPYEKSGQSTAMEICKQLYDLSKLFEQISSVEVVAESFRVFAEHEIKYRKEKLPDLTPERVLHDIIDTCLVITKRERGSTEEKEKFAQIQKGIIAFGTGYLISGNFRIDDAIQASARIAYLAAKILANDLSPITYFLGQDIKDLIIEDPDRNFQNRLKRQPDKSSFYYWYKTIELIVSPL